MRGRSDVNRETGPDMNRLLKFLAGLAMLPLCAALLRSAGGLLLEVARSPSGRAQCAGLAIGFALWIFCFFTMPRPMWSYVLGHELTHALWTLLFGGRASGLRVSERGGQVRVTKTNIWIDLSPYFFPFYTMIVLAAYGITGAFTDLSAYRPFWMGLIGLTWGFHLTFTASLLTVHQSDIQEHGHLFSYTLILIVNALGAGLWIALLSGIGGVAWFNRLWTHTLWAYTGLADLIRRAAEAFG